MRKNKSCARQLRNSDESDFLVCYSLYYERDRPTVQTNSTHKQDNTAERLAHKPLTEVKLGWVEGEDKPGSRFKQEIADVDGSRWVKLPFCP